MKPSNVSVRFASSEKYLTRLLRELEQRLFLLPVMTYLVCLLSSAVPVWPSPPFNLLLSNSREAVLRLPPISRSYPEQPVQGYFIGVRVLQPSSFATEWFRYGTIVPALVGRVQEQVFGNLEPGWVYAFRLFATNDSQETSGPSEEVVYPYTVPTPTSGEMLYYYRALGQFPR